MQDDRVGIGCLQADHQRGKIGGVGRDGLLQDGFRLERGEGFRQLVPGGLTVGHALMDHGRASGTELVHDIAGLRGFRDGVARQEAEEVGIPGF